jgi:hypothetical protein
MLATIAKRRDATVITLIHRQKTLSLLGVPLARYIDSTRNREAARPRSSTSPVRGFRPCCLPGTSPA